MTNDDHELAAAYVLDQLEAGERSAFAARLAREPDLATAVDALEAKLAARVRALPQHAPAPDLLARIEQQIPPFQKISSPGISWTAVARWGIAAVIAIGVATLAVQSLRRPAPPTVVVVTMNPGGTTRDELPGIKPAPGTDAAFIDLASLAERYWRNPAKALPAIAPAANREAGYAIFDPGSNQGFVGVHHLPAAASGKRYCLWIVDTQTGRTYEAGIIPLAAARDGLFSFALDPAAGALITHPDFLVTAEADNTTPHDQPEGDIVLGAKRM